MTRTEADAAIRGITTEAVLRSIVGSTDTTDVLSANAPAIIAALVRRLDRKADRRAAKVAA